VVAGCTDVGLWVTKQHKRFPAVLDLTRVTALRRSHGRTASCHRRRRHADRGLCRPGAALPRAAPLCPRFAGLPVRNSGTLGGNVANGSPIGDSMPLLIALGAQIVLASGGRAPSAAGRPVHRLPPERDGSGRAAGAH
jgi:xanthine dehydrogenase small subunit